MTEVQFLRGESERIGKDVTPIQDGYCYLCVDNGKFYIDVIDGDIKKRFCINGVSEYQGVENAGKIMAVDASGYIAPIENNFSPTGQTTTWRALLSRYLWRDLYGQTN